LRFPSRFRCECDGTGQNGHTPSDVKTATQLSETKSADVYRGYFGPVSSATDRQARASDSRGDNLGSARSRLEMLKLAFDIFTICGNAVRMYDKDSPFGPRRSSLSQGGLARDEIASAILSLALPPDSIVTEAALTKRFALSLAATRAALARLAEQGWASAEARRGWRILPVTGRHLSDLTLARRTLEPTLRDARPNRDQMRELEIQGRIYNSLLHLHDPDATEKLIWQELRLRLALAELMPQPRMRAWLMETWQMCARADLYLHRRLGFAIPPTPMADLLHALRQDAPIEMLAALSIGAEAFAARAGRTQAHSDALIGDTYAVSAGPGLGCTATSDYTTKRRPTPPAIVTTDRREP